MTEEVTTEAMIVPVIETRASVVIGDVDIPERIITVVAVPYEQPTKVPFRGGVWDEVFMRSAFRGMESSTRRIPVTACLKLPQSHRNEDHADAELVGRAARFFPDRDEGLIADLKISRTTAGDNTLELARDNALAPSAGFMVKSRLDEQLDRSKLVRRISRAFLDHIAFVATPAYPGARVLAMRSDGSAEEPPSNTPLLDEFLTDPFFQAILNRKNS